MGSLIFLLHFYAEFKNKITKLVARLLHPYFRFPPLFLSALLQPIYMFHCVPHWIINAKKATLDQLGR